MIRKTLAIIAFIAIICFVKIHYFSAPHNLLNPITDLKSWNWEQFGGASGGLYPDGGGIRCEILKTDGTSWHVQLYQVVAPLVDGKDYHIHFMAKADGNFKIYLSATLGEDDIHSVGLQQDVLVNSQWAAYDYTFKAEKVNNKKTRIPVMMLGTQTGKVWIKDIVVTEE